MLQRILHHQVFVPASPGPKGEAKGASRRNIQKNHLTKGIWFKLINEAIVSVLKFVDKKDLTACYCS